MEKLYIVRHGESENNAKRIFQDGTPHLSEKGIKQAQALAKRVTKLPDIDLIVCSPFTRTRETLAEIQKIKEYKTVFTDLAIEIERPSELIGKSVDSDESQAVFDQIDENKDNPDWHYSDEENFTDLKLRTIKLLKFLESFDDKNILLVAHGVLLKMLISVMMFGDNLTATEHNTINNFLATRNTGITLCEKKNDKWNMVTWNDIAHLG